MFDVVSLTWEQVAILDESTRSGGVGATISAIVAEEFYDELDAPVCFGVGLRFSSACCFVFMVLHPI